MVSIIIQTYCKKYLFKNNLKLSQPHSQKSIQISLDQIIETVKGPDNDWNRMLNSLVVDFTTETTFYLFLEALLWKSRKFISTNLLLCGKVQNKICRNSVQTYFLFQNCYCTFTIATEIIKGKFEKIFDLKYFVKMLSRTSLLIIVLRFKRF